MIAVAEGILGHDLESGRLVWHRPVGQAVDDFQAIACSDEEGITLPGGRRDVPVKLDVPGQSWCAECLSATDKSKS